MEPQRKKSFILLIALLILLGSIPLLWPGDAPWINDEPRLIQMAMDCKNSGTWPSHGIMGSRGIIYGPFPLWIYTALLHVTDDLIDLVRIRAFLVTLVSAISIAWIASSCRNLTPAAGALALLSPYLWLYSRQLWDNTFLIPLSALSAAAYVSFCVRPAAWKFWMAGIALTFMLLTHLMSAAWIVPLLLHGVWFHGRWIREHVLSAAAQAVVAVLISWPYFTLLCRVPQADLPHPAYSLWAGWFFPFLGGQFFSAFGLDYFFGEEWETGGIWIFSQITFLALPLVWVGMSLTVRRLWQIAKSAGDMDADAHLGLLACATILTQCLLNGLMRAYGHPHYFNATWVGFLYFFWTALSSIPAPRISQSVYALSMAVVLGFLILQIHRSAGNQTIHYGPALGHQVDIVRQIHAYHPASPIYTEIPNYKLVPHAFKTLRRFYGLNGTDTGPLKELTILPADEAGREGRMKVEETLFSR